MLEQAFGITALRRGRVLSGTDDSERGRGALKTMKRAGDHGCDELMIEKHRSPTYNINIEEKH